ncbi:MAG: tetratricopeptide repeat protein [Lentisphaeria bacterium]|nr:tetratricopeptide repeat protein [Lentisphaeria bacterium]
MCNGRPVLDDVPPGSRPGEKIVEDTPEEYAALKEIVGLLKGHAWSLEIVAGFMAENFEHYSFREELADLKENPLANLPGTTYRGGGVQSPETLLRPTLQKLRELDRFAEDFGQHVLRLAAAASFFPPERVPEYALEGIWKQEFGDGRITCDGGWKKAFACSLALEQLRNYRIVNGKGGLLKMHRLTREVLQNGLSPEEKSALVRSMQRFLDDFQAETPHMTAEQVLPWAGWATECLEKNESLRKDAVFLKTLNNLANLHSDLYQYAKAEEEYSLALNLYKKLAKNNHDKFDPDVAMTLNNLAILHKNLNQYAKAEGEYSEALDIRRRLAQNNPDKFNPCVANTLNNLANLCRRRLFGPSKFGPVRFLHGLMHPEFRKKAAELREEAVEIAKKYPENPFCRKILASPEPGDLKK